MKRYTIHHGRTGVLTLVFDDRAGRWLVETAGPKDVPDRLSLEDFEASVGGQALVVELADAIQRAQDDF
jgi:hypothetical protein